MKLVKEDDKMFHFAGKDGEFKVLKKGLSKPAQQKIEAIKSAQKLSDGGAVAPVDPDKAAPIVKQFSQNSSDKAVSNAVNHPFDTIAKVAHFYDGTKNGNVGQSADAQFDAPLASDSDADPDAINPGQPVVAPDRSPASAAPADEGIASKIGNFIGDKVIGGTARGIGQLYNGLKDDLTPLGNFTQGVEKGLGVNTAPTDTTQALTQKPDDNSAAAIQAKIDAFNKAAGAQQPVKPGMSYDDQLTGYMNDYGRNANTLAGIQQQGAQQNADAVSKYLDMGAQYLKTSQDAQQQIQDENADLAKQVANSTIDPNKFVNNMSTGNKIATGIGILFSGMGAGAHGTNLAMSVLQDTIDKDIDAQKANLGNKQNLLTQNLHRLGNMQAATAATQAQRYSMLQGQIMQQAYQDGSAGALNQAKMAQDMLQAKLVPLHQQLGQYDAQRALLSRTDIDPMTKAMMLGGPSTPMGKMYMQQAQQKQMANQTMKDYDQAAKDKGSLKYLFRDSPAQKKLAVDTMAPLHKNLGLRGESLQHASTAFQPSILGKITGDNDLTRGNLFNMTNQNQLMSPMATPASGAGDEGEE